MQKHTLLVSDYSEGFAFFQILLPIAHVNTRSSTWLIRDSFHFGFGLWRGSLIQRGV